MRNTGELGSISHIAWRVMGRKPESTADLKWPAFLCVHVSAKPLLKWINHCPKISASLWGPKYIGRQDSNVQMAWRDFNRLPGQVTQTQGHEHLAFGWLTGQEGAKSKVLFYGFIQGQWSCPLAVQPLDHWDIPGRNIGPFWVQSNLLSGPTIIKLRDRKSLVI